MAKLAWVFDFDGTLLDSMTAFQRLAGRVMARTYDISPTRGEEQYRQTSGIPFFQQLEQLYPTHPRNAAAASAFETDKLASYRQARPFPEAPEVLSTLRRHGHFVAISSNNFQPLVDDMVAQLQLPVDLVCGWQDGHGKGPAHFQAIAKQSGLGTDATIFVGDSLHDAKMAHAHRIRFAGRSGTFSTEEFQSQFPGIRVIASLRELLQ